MYLIPPDSDEGFLTDSFHRHALFVFFIGLLLVTFSACSGSPTDANTGNGGGGGNGGGDTEPVANEVIISGLSYSPSSIQIEVGETVTWRNQSSQTHTVTSGSNRQHDDEFDSGNLAPGADFAFTFTEAGDFDYFCIPHVGMAGSVTVIEPADASVRTDGAAQRRGIR